MLATFQQLEDREDKIFWAPAVSLELKVKEKNLIKLS
jgi:hypothetical protein